MATYISPMNRRLSAALLALFGFLAQGCTSFDETYYVGIVDPSQTPDTTGSRAPQFYRYQMHGTAVFSETKFEAGLFNAQAVDRLFGEITPGTSSTTSVAGETATVRDIPALVVDGVAGPKAEVTVTRASAALSLSEANFPLSNLQSLHAKKITVQYKVSENGQVINITGIHVIGISAANFVANAKETEIQFSNGIGEIPRATIVGTITCQAPQSLRCVGGNLVIATTNPSVMGDTWRGSEQFAQTESPYHRAIWEGGTFVIRSPSVKSSPGVIEATSATAEFEKITRFVAEKGCQMVVTGGSISAALSSISDITSPDAAGDVTGTSFDKLSVGGNLMEILRAAKPPAGDGTKEFSDADLSGTSFSIGSTDAPVRVSAAKLTASNLTVKGTAYYQITTDAAVTAARAGGRSVAIEADPDRHVYMRFGPEGTAVAQSDSDRLVVVMHNDPRAVTQRIKAMVDSDRTKLIISKAVSHPHEVEQQSSVRQAKADLTLAKGVAAQLESSLNSTDSSDVLKALIKQFLDQLPSD